MKKKLYIAPTIAVFVIRSEGRFLDIASTNNPENMDAGDGEWSGETTEDGWL